MDLSKVTPAPWYDDGYRIYGPTDDPDKRSGGVIMEYKYSDHAMDDDGEFCALARNALDVMMRRGWHAMKCLQSDDWFVQDAFQSEIVLEFSTRRDEMIRACYAKDPFTALVQADKWYAENIENKSR